jgi:hypothetical protein
MAYYEAMSGHNGQFLEVDSLSKNNQILPESFLSQK